MNIFLYSHYFHPSVGGVETYVRLLADGFAKTTQVKNVTLGTRTEPRPDGDHFLFLVVRKPSVWALAKLIRSSDLVMVAGPSLVVMILSYVLRRPFVVEHHGYQAICPNGLLLNKAAGNSICDGHFQAGNWRECAGCLTKTMTRLQAVQQILATALRQHLCRNAAGNIGVSEHVVRRHQLPRMRPILHGIDAPLPLAQACRREGLEHLRFGYVGRLVEEKGLERLIRTVGKLREEGLEFEVVLIGDGPERKKLEASAQHLGLQGTIRFTGFATGERLSAEVSEIDVLIMPSIWEETAGLAAIEQMAKGKAIFAARIGGLAEIVAEGGRLFDPFSDTELADLMRIAINQPDSIQEVSQRGRSRFETAFRKERMIEEHIQVFRICLSKQQG